MRSFRLTWHPPGTVVAPGPDTTRCALLGLHLLGSLLVLLASWPPGWRLGEPILTSPFRSWWGVEAIFLGLVALQFGAGRWRGPSEGAPACSARPADDLLWLLLVVASVVPAGLAAYRVGSAPVAPPVSLIAALAAELLFFWNLGRALRLAGVREPVLGVAAWGLFVLLALGVWFPGVLAVRLLPAAIPLPALGPVPYPLLLEQPALAVGSWQLPPAVFTAAGWSLAALGARAAGRLLGRRERGRGE